MRELAAIHADRDQVREAIANAGQGTDVSQWQVEEMRYTDELAEATAYWESQAATTERIMYILDTMTVEGLTIAEIITNDDEYKLVRKGVQDAFIVQAENFQNELRDQEIGHNNMIKILTDRANHAEQSNEQLRKDSNDLEVKNYELGLVNEELSEKVRKVAELQHETNQQIEQQKTHIDELQKQLALGIRGALNVVDIPQDTSKMAAEIIARKVRITNVRFKDENGIDTRIKRAENVLTGETFEYEALYEKRYIILNETEAEQYRADEANKKAEAEQQLAVIPTIEQEIAPVNPVTEVVEAAENTPLQIPTADSQGDSADVRNESVDESLEQNAEESQVMREADLYRKPVTRVEHEALKQAHAELTARVSRIEEHANIQAVA